MSYGLSVVIKYTDDILFAKYCGVIPNFPWEPLNFVPIEHELLAFEFDIFD